MKSPFSFFWGSIVLICFMISSCSPSTNGEEQEEICPDRPSAPDTQEPEYQIPPPDSAYQWWPEQKLPESVVKCTYLNNIPERALAESLSGLAAQAVNQDEFKEMVWLPKNDKDLQLWYQCAMEEHALKDAGTEDVWQLLERYQKSGLIKGYVLYEDWNRGHGSSINIATTIAGVEQCILVEKSIESRVQNLGIKKVADATKMGEESVFEKYKSSLNRKMLIAIEPKLGNLRDLAIAQKAICIYGLDSYEKKVMAWLEPFSPIFGWNTGDEFLKTALPSSYGHFVVPSSLCMNLPLLSAGARETILKKAPQLDPKTIDFSDKESSFHSFVMSDGGNFRYTTANFYHNPDYWANPDCRTIPMSWTFCPANMSMGNPYAWNQLMSETEISCVFEFGGGYHYPDMFASNRKDREELQRTFARMLNLHFQKNGIKVFGFICKDRKSSEAMKAYRIFAEEIKGLVGMLAVQYNPYEDGKGEIIWVKNAEGVEIPVLFPKYSLWANTGKPTKGGPDRISSMISQDAERGQNFNASMVHAWSRYRMNGDGSVSEADSHDKTAAIGVTPVKWTKNKLDKRVKVVTLEELFWRIRMKYNEEETKEILKCTEKL